jgi:DNA-binding SARP family transcriptional activator/TolB-like protein
MTGGNTTATNPIRLRTLGTLDVSGPDVRALQALVSQPKRAALLVYLAVARPSGLQRRDTLVALLWPETEQTRARHALSQIVYQLRRALGAEALVSRGDDAVGIDPGRVWCDVAAFDAALAENRPEDALELYRGDFLAGFFTPDASPDLDEWIAAERSRLRIAAAGAAWILARRDEQARNAAGAAHWAHRAVALTPDDERATAELIRLQGRLGDRAGALRTYDAFVRRLQTEFGIQPSPELKRAADELRQAPGADDPVPGARPAPAAPSSATRRAAPGLWQRRGWLGLAAVVMIAAALLLARGRQGTAGSPLLAVGTVSDFTRGDSGSPAPVVGDLLATSLARLPTVQVIATARLYEVQAQLLTGARSGATVYDAARAAGARQLIQGTLHTSPAGVRLDLQRIDIGSGAVRGGYRVDGADLFAAVDQATIAIAHDLGATAPAEPVASVTTHSLVAYRFYEEGLRAFYQGDAAAADRLFRSALEEDSSFAMAAYWVWKTRGEGEHVSLVRAAQLADHATDRERLMIRFRLAQSDLDPAGLAIAETLAVRYPAELEAQMILGDTRAARGDYVGAISALRKVIGLDSLAFSGRPTLCRACDAYAGLSLAYVYADSLDAAVRVVHEWMARQPGAPPPWSLLSHLMEVGGREDAALAAFQVMDSLSRDPASPDPLLARLAIRRGDFDQADQRLHRMVAERSWADAEWFLAVSLRTQGRLAEAAALPITKASVLHGVLLLDAGRWGEAAAFFQRQSRPWDPTKPIIGHQAKNLAFNLTQVATSLAAAGDTGRLARLADSIAWAGNHCLPAREAHLARYVRGLLLAARGQLPQAAEEYRASILSWNEGYTRANYALAQTLLRLNRPREAIAALQPAFRGSLEAANLYVSRTELHELLAQSFDAAGERDSARVHWGAVARAWKSADPPFRQRWATAVLRSR